MHYYVNQNIVKYISLHMNKHFSRASYYHDYTSKMIIEENIQGHVVIDKRNLAMQS